MNRTSIAMAEYGNSIIDSASSVSLTELEEQCEHVIDRIVVKYIN